MSKAIVVVSGGMDSITMLHDVVKNGNFDEVEGLSFYYGSKHNDIELPLAKKNCEKLGIKHTLINLSFINEHFESNLLKSGDEIPKGHYEEDNMKKTVVPFRNGIMLSIAAGFAESKNADTLYIGAHAGDHAIYPDCRSDFMDAMREAINRGTWKGVMVSVPYQDIDKSGILKIGSKIDVDYNNTWTCYEPVTKENGEIISCGICGSCTERREAFENNKIEDPKKYNNLTKNWIK